MRYLSLSSAFLSYTQTRIQFPSHLHPSPSTLYPYLHPHPLNHPPNNQPRKPHNPQPGNLHTQPARRTRSTRRSARPAGRGGGASPRARGTGSRSRSRSRRRRIIATRCSDNAAAGVALGRGCRFDFLGGGFVGFEGVAGFPVCIIC